MPLRREDSPKASGFLMTLYSSENPTQCSVETGDCLLQPSSKTARMLDVISARSVARRCRWESTAWGPAASRTGPPGRLLQARGQLVQQFQTPWALAAGRVCLLPHSCFLKITLVLHLWLCQIFVPTWASTLVAASAGCSVFLAHRLLTAVASLVAEDGGLRRVGFSCGSVWALECKLSSCGGWACLLHSLWDLPRPGFEPMPPAGVGRFLTTVLPGKPSFFITRIC